MPEGSTRFGGFRGFGGLTPVAYCWRPQPGHVFLLFTTKNLDGEVGCAYCTPVQINPLNPPNPVEPSDIDARADSNFFVLTDDRLYY